MSKSDEYCYGEHDCDASDGIKQAKKEINEMIETVGHAVIATEIEVDGAMLGLSFTVGLSRLGLSELITFSLEPDVARLILNSSAFMLASGKLFADAQIECIAKGLTVVFKEAKIEKVREVAGALEIFAEVEAPKVLQLVWPDAANNFPWSDHFDKSLVDLQPLLY